MDGILNILFPMIVVVLIILAAYMTTKWIAKKQNTYTSGRLIKIIERVMLSKDVFLAVVQIDEKIFLISVSSGKTELLTELDPSVIDNIKPAENNGGFMDILMSITGAKKDKNNPKGRDKDEK